MTIKLENLGREYNPLFFPSEKNSDWLRLGHMTIWAGYIVVTVILEHGGPMIDPDRSLGSRGGTVSKRTEFK